MSTTIIRDNKSIHENNQFHIIEGLYDSIFERMDKAIDMKKGLLTDVEDVFLYSLILIYRMHNKKPALIVETQ